MFRSLKRVWLLIPCMVVAFFLFSGSSASAATKGNAVLTNGVKEVVGAEDKKNTYYFSNDDFWEFLVTDYKLISGDRYVKWRVVRPDGKATEWHGNGYDSSVFYVDNKGRFTISDYNSLSYGLVDTGDGFDRTTIAPGVTYFVDIQYYSHIIWSTYQKGKDETLKIIVSDDVPTVSIDYDSNANSFNIETSFKTGEMGVITDVKYMFSSTSLNYSAVENNANLVETSFVPSNDVQVAITGDGTSRYLYVVVTTGNGVTTINVYDNNQSNSNNGNQVGTNQATTQTNNENKGSGIGDYDLGQMILIILVIVLIVSCALIITQKIVDYKKRLY